MVQSRDLGQHQLPFSRNTNSPFSQASFSPTSNRAAYPLPNQPPQAAPTYTDRAQRPSDPYYKQQRPYCQDASSNHVRHQMGSSIVHGASNHRNLLPPSSPQQRVPPDSHQNYAPNPLRTATAPVVQPLNFSGARELPSLIPMCGTRAGGMAIADILGEPSTSEIPSQYSSPVTTSGPLFGSSHASPRTGSSRTELAPFRQPLTPEHSKRIELRDKVTNLNGPTADLVRYKTPEAQRFGTPQLGQQLYPQRPRGVEERMDSGKMTHSNLPPRPNSQPNNYSISKSCDVDQTIVPRVVDISKADATSRPVDAQKYAGTMVEERDQHRPYVYTERECSERELIQVPLAESSFHCDRNLERERDRNRGKGIILQHEREKQEQKELVEQEYSREFTRQAVQHGNVFSRPPEPVERSTWLQNGAYEPPRPVYEPIPEKETLLPPRPPNSFAYQTTASAQYLGKISCTGKEQNYNPPNSLPFGNNSVCETVVQEPSGIAQQQQQPNRQQRQTVYNFLPQNSSSQLHEPSSKRHIEDSQPLQQRSILGLQDSNRKGRASPSPQAVQGVQTQTDGPGGEPSIKNEFGRMFSGIGSGVGSVLQMPISNTSSNYSNNSNMRREDTESLQELQTTCKPHSLPLQTSKRRKLQEDKGDEESIPERIAQNGKPKKPKTGHHHHHHHHRRIENTENNSCRNQLNLTPFRSAKVTMQAIHDNDAKNINTHHHHHVPNRHHHHHHSTTNKGLASIETPTISTVATVPKLSVLNDSVLQSVATLPRHHLGHGYYCCTLRTSSNQHSNSNDVHNPRGFSSTPNPLPRFVGRENCTYTVRVPRIYLEDAVREEVTHRKALWGTDIYTDDSDILAACIHAGWFRGAWAEDIDVSLLGLELKNDPNGDPMPPDIIEEGQLLEKPSEKGPGHAPSGCDCHVTILVLPLLERYASSTRFGIKSREWGIERDGWKSKHDGLSFMIQSVRFVNGVDGEEGRSGRSRRNILGKQLREKEANNEDFSSNILSYDSGLQIKESFVREKNLPSRLEGFKGLGMGGWWRGGDRKNRGKDILEETHLSAENQPPNTNLAKINPHVAAVNCTIQESSTETVITSSLPISSNLTPGNINYPENNHIAQVTQRMLKNYNQHHVKSPLANSRISVGSSKSLACGELSENTPD
ncbi:unnamed protein product [Blumeria hordei]|uniref:Histone deacetylation protein Rxt3 n=1 Tax=Blumeria hordei TaxID=2867405 RepID=A0A383UWD3_BLUHO|nr:unnamed protein product [Blumeria hordei]